MLGQIRGCLSRSHLSVTVGDGHVLVAPVLAPKACSSSAGQGSSSLGAAASTVSQRVLCSHRTFISHFYLCNIERKSQVCQLRGTWHPVIPKPASASWTIHAWHAIHHILLQTPQPNPSPNQTCLSQAVPGNHRLQITQADSKIQYIVLLLNTFTPTDFLKPSPWRFQGAPPIPPFLKEEEKTILF